MGDLVFSGKRVIIPENRNSLFLKTGIEMWCVWSRMVSAFGAQEHIINLVGIRIIYGIEFLVSGRGTEGWHGLVETWKKREETGWQGLNLSTCNSLALLVLQRRFILTSSRRKWPFFSLTTSATYIANPFFLEKKKRKKIRSPRKLFYYHGVS